MDLLQRRQARGDLRKAERHALHIPAYITSGDRSDRHNCIIHDISLLGARLTVGARADIPNEFTLVFARNCRVVRRTDGQVGVEFLLTET